MLHAFFTGKNLARERQIRFFKVSFREFINENPDDRVEKNEITSDINDDFEFNQDNSIEYDDGYRSPGWDRYKKNKMLKWKK